jgi:hypothetical protein
MHEHAVHLVPQHIMGDRIAAEQHGAQLAGDDGGHRFWHRPGNGVHSNFGLDLDKAAFDAEMGCVGLHAALEIVSGTVVGVDVDRADQPFFPERTVGFQGAVQPAQTCCREFHAFFLALSGFPAEAGAL